MMAATRGMLAAGAAFLLAERIPVDKRKKIGWPLLAVGALSTIPIAMHIFKKMKDSDTLSIEVDSD